MRALIVFASLEGQTAQVARRIAQRMSGSGVPTDIYSVLEAPADEIAIETYDAVLFGSPIHYGQHDSRIAWCIREYRHRLRDLPTGFFSVGLGLASEHEQDRSEAIRLADDFLAKLNWEPTLKQSFAGALRYSRYGWLKKQMMRWIAKQSGKVTDVARDYDYTDWRAVDDFAEQFTAAIRRQAGGGEIGSRGQLDAPFAGPA